MASKSKVAQIQEQIDELERYSFPYDILKGWKQDEMWWRTSDQVHPADSREWVRLHEKLNKAKKEESNG